MMLVPRRNDFDLLDEIFENEFFSRKEKNLMKTDIVEKKDKYVLDIDLPGFEKENINLSLNNGYLEINAKVEKNEKNEEHEKFVRQERFFGECSRSFYVGEEVLEDEIEAEFKNGTLKITIPKKEIKKELPESKHIAIK